MREFELGEVVKLMNREGTVRTAKITGFVDGDICEIYLMLTNGTVINHHRKITTAELNDQYGRFMKYVVSRQMSSTMCKLKAI